MLEAIRILQRLQTVMNSRTSLSGLKFVHIVRKNLKVVVCIDAFFAVSIDKLSRLGVLAMMKDWKIRNVDIVYYTQCKSRSINKSVLASELFALTEGSDIGFCIHHSLQSILDKKSVLNVYTDSQSLNCSCISFAQTTDRRLQVDLYMIFVPYEGLDVCKIISISGFVNAADGPTKRISGMVCWRKLCQITNSHRPYRARYIDTTSKCKSATMI